MSLGPRGQDLSSLPPSTPKVEVLLESHGAHCFGCGPENPKGLQLRVLDEGMLRVSSTFFVDSLFCGATGLAHGGILATAIDEVLSFLGRLLGLDVVTGQLTLSYCRPVLVNTTVDICARVTRQSGRKLYAEAAIQLSDGSVAVKGSALFIQVILDQEKPE